MFQNDEAGKTKRSRGKCKKRKLEEPSTKLAIDIENSIPSNSTEGCENHQCHVTMNNAANDDDHSRHLKTNHNESSSLDLNVGHYLLVDGADTTAND